MRKPRHRRQAVRMTGCTNTSRSSPLRHNPERPPLLELPVYGLRLQVHQLVVTAMDPLVPLTEPKEPITVTSNEIIYQRRVRVMEHAKKTSVSEACRTFGVSRTTFYRWQQRIEAGGLDALMPKRPTPASDAEPDPGMGRRRTVGRSSCSSDSRSSPLRRRAPRTRVCGFGEWRAEDLEPSRPRPASSTRRCLSRT